MKRRLLTTILLVAFPVVGSCPVSGFALDLDDGIEIDDSIDNYHELGKLETNVTYLVMNAMSSAKRSAANSTKQVDNDTSENNSENNSESSGSYTNSKKTGGNISSINTINIGAGSTINGDVILIDNSQGGHTAISK